MTSPRHSAAQVLHPIITVVTHRPNTVGDRVMRCLLDWPTRNTSPDIEQLIGSRAWELSSAVEGRLDPPRTHVSA